MPRMSQGQHAAAASTALFFNTPTQRTALARERFFESGERPSGLVSEAVIQSWTRCLAARQSPRHSVAFEPVTRARLQATLERNQALHQAARNDITRLETALAGTGSRVLLTDAQGVIVHATALPARNEEKVLNLVARVGVNLSEGQTGTNAPAVVVKTGQPVTVQGAEHYFSCVQSLHCAASPIRDGQGRLAGVLDLTIEARPFAFDAAALVGVYATMIENRLLQATAGEGLVLQFQVCSSMLGSPLEALVGINTHGRLAWLNGTAQKLLGLGAAQQLSQDGTAVGRMTHDTTQGGDDAEHLFGLNLSQLLALSGAGNDVPLHLPNGLTVWLRAKMAAKVPVPLWRLTPPARPVTPAPAMAPAASAPSASAPAMASAPAAIGASGSLSTSPFNGLPTGAAALAPTAPARPITATPATLDQVTGDIIERTLADCKGNISRAARRLGVSRGLLYRRLNAALKPGAQGS
jgi:sigma-54 dependent transcriptional regulator, acetoin dehydrogenase operon transcriptional activator AcoR